MSERTSAPTTKTPEYTSATAEALDERWFPELLDIAAFGDEIYTELRLSKEELTVQKNRFLSGEVENPDLKPHVDITDVEHRAEMLLDLKNRILAEEENDVVKAAYRWKINELVANLRMLRASATGDTRRYDAYNHLVYGAPERETFELENNFYHVYAQAHAESDNPNICEAAEDLLEKLPALSEESDHTYAPSDEAFAGVKTAHDTFFQDLLEGIEFGDKKIVSAEEAGPIIDKMLRNIGAENYTREKIEGNKTWSVKHGNQKVVVPDSETFNVKRLVGLGGGHELKTHIHERLNGAKTNLKLLSLGLDRQERSSEGKAVVREQVVYDDFSEFEKLLRHRQILARHFAISLAYGHGGEPRDFREVFTTMQAIEYLQAVSKKPEDPEAAKEIAASKAWDLLATRTHRGAAGAGSYYGKDKLYAEGNLAYWALGEEHPELVDDWDLGKVDLTNPRHIWILSELGILPAEKIDRLLERPAQDYNAKTAIK